MSSKWIPKFELKPEELVQEDDYWIWSDNIMYNEYCRTMLDGASCLIGKSYKQAKGEFNLRIMRLNRKTLKGNKVI